MKKSQYFKKCMEQDRDWLEWAACNPSGFMSRVHIRLVKLAARKKGSEKFAKVVSHA